MKISDILRHKGAGVVTVAPDAAVTELLRLLSEHGIGALVVVDGGAGGAGGQVAGIVSERDVVRRLAERGSSILEATVGDIMTTDVLSCDAQDSIDDVAETMTTHRVRHMPVISDGELTGIVSIGDVVLSRIRQLEQDRGQLEQYITG